jgi:hypothetical protein
MRAYASGAAIIMATWLLVGCTGGSTTPASPSGTSATVTFTVPTTGVQEALPPLAGVTTVIEIPSGDTSQAFTMTVTESTALPSGFPSSSLQLTSTANLYLTVSESGGPATLPAAPFLLVTPANAAGTNTMTAYVVGDGATGASSSSRGRARPSATRHVAATGAGVATAENGDDVAGTFTASLGGAPGSGFYTGTTAIYLGATNPQAGCIDYLGSRADFSACVGPYSVTASNFTTPVSLSESGTAFGNPASINWECPFGQGAYAAGSLPIQGNAVSNPVQPGANLVQFTGTITAPLTDGAAQCAILPEYDYIGGELTFAIDFSVVSGPPGPLTLSPGSVYVNPSIIGIVVSEANYFGSIIMTSTTCPHQVLLEPYVELGPPEGVPPSVSYYDVGPVADFQITETANLSLTCSITFSDDHGGSQALTVVTGLGIPSPSPSGSASPSPASSASPTPAPTATPTPSPTPTPTPTPVPTAQASVTESLPVEMPIEIFTTNAGVLPVPPAGLGYTAAAIYFGQLSAATSATISVGSQNFAPTVFGSLQISGETPVEFLALQFAQSESLLSTIGQGGIVDGFCLPSSLLTAPSYTFFYFNSGSLIGTQSATNSSGCLEAAAAVPAQTIPTSGGLGILVATP